MLDILLDSVIDCLKLLIYLFPTFLLIEYFEHRFDANKLMSRFTKHGPLLGGLLGALPQCGFSVSMTNLYLARIISLGTLVAVYLSTSDEMLPVMLAHQVNIFSVLKILFIKVVIGIGAGYLIDKLLKDRGNGEVTDFCEQEKCECETKGIWYAAFKHTANTLIFIFAITLILNGVLYYFSADLIAKILLKGSLLSPVLAGMIGLIPNCGSSIALTELLLSGSISFGAAMAGLLANCGVGLLVLFRSSHDKKRNAMIVAIIYLIGVTFGVLFEIFNFNIIL
ncbi:MAG: arsenic efflux protein [Erysipelotrichaceae bacterium]|nr:arsenic efflux protein [Erysipelotrichaceae bacterium]